MIDRIGIQLGRVLGISGLIMPYAALPLPTTYAILAIPAGIVTALYGLTVYARSTNQIEAQKLEEQLHTLCNTTTPAAKRIRKMNWSEIKELQSRIDTYEGQSLEALLTITPDNVKRHEI